MLTLKVRPDRLTGRTLNYTTRAATFSSPQLLFTLAVSAERARDLYADINPACLTRNLVLPF